LSLASPKSRPTGSCDHKPAGDCLASGDHTQDGSDGDDETDEFKLDTAAEAAAAVAAEDARRVKPWLTELDVPEWQELEHQYTETSCVAGAVRRWAERKISPRNLAKWKGNSGTRQF
jgi:hypothetical protein